MTLTCFLFTSQESHVFNSRLAPSKPPPPPTSRTSKFTSRIIAIHALLLAPNSLSRVSACPQPVVRGVQHECLSAHVVRADTCFMYLPGKAIFQKTLRCAHSTFLFQRSYISSALGFLCCQGNLVIENLQNQQERSTRS